MAKKVTRKAKAPTPPKGKAASRPAKAAKSAKKPAKPRKPAKAAPSKRQPRMPKAAEPSFNTAGEALAALLESPLATEVLAAGAAAGLAAMTQHALAKREGGAKTALKEGAKAAATAMGTRLATEIDGILKSAKDSKA